MAETAISICSRALVMLGAQPLNSLEPWQGDTALICANVYPGVKASLMSRYPWRFLMKKAELTRDTETPTNEWGYSYLLPGDMLSLPHASFNGQSASGTGVEIFGRRLYSNWSRVVCDYVADRPESEWPAYFVDLVVKALAADIALAVTDQQNTADSWRMAAFGTPGEGGVGGAYGEAMAIDSQGSGNNGLQTNGLEMARFGVYDPISGLNGAYGGTVVITPV